MPSIRAIAHESTEKAFYAARHKIAQVVGIALPRPVSHAATVFDGSVAARAHSPRRRKSQSPLRYHRFHSWLRELSRYLASGRYGLFGYYFLPADPDLSGLFFV